MSHGSVVLLVVPARVPASGSSRLGAGVRGPIIVRSRRNGRESRAASALAARRPPRGRDRPRRFDARSPLGYDGATTRTERGGGGVPFESASRRLPGPHHHNPLPGGVQMAQRYLLVAVLALVVLLAGV